MEAGSHVWAYNRFGHLLHFALKYVVVLSKNIFMRRLGVQVLFDL